jgi:hypothetical protein
VVSELIGRGANRQPLAFYEGMALKTINMAEQSKILRESQLQGAAAKESFAVRAARLRSRLSSDADSAALVRADRDRDTVKE